MSIPKLRTSGRMLVAGGLVFAALISGSTSAEAVTHTTGYSAVTSYMADYSAPKSVPRTVTASYTVNLVKAAPMTVALSNGVKIINYIEKHDMGVPYLWGGTTHSGFDCSGLIMSAAHSVGDWRMPRIAQDQANSIRRIPNGQQQRGDLVFFHNSSGVFHVGIYSGWRNGTMWMINAPKTGDNVEWDPLTYHSSWFSYITFGRP